MEDLQKDEIKSSKGSNTQKNNNDETETESETTTTKTMTTTTTTIMYNDIQQLYTTAAATATAVAKEGKTKTWFLFPSTPPSTSLNRCICHLLKPCPVSVPLQEPLTGSPHLQPRQGESIPPVTNFFVYWAHARGKYSRDLRRTYL